MATLKEWIRTLICASKSPDFEAQKLEKPAIALNKVNIMSSIIKLLEMKKFRIILLVNVFTLISCSNYVEYVPRVIENDKITKKPILMTLTHKKNIVEVLKYYNEDWKIENGKIYISSVIDEEILWNYTTKANDTVWVYEH